MLPIKTRPLSCFGKKAVFYLLNSLKYKTFEYNPSSRASGQTAANLSALFERDHHEFQMVKWEIEDAATIDEMRVIFKACGTTLEQERKATEALVRRYLPELLS
jgi:DNA/RNA-binding domain of Phe-tRNA-synthetase-like protein